MGSFAGPHFGGPRIAGVHGDHFHHARGPFIGGYNTNYGFDCPYYPAYRYAWNNYDCLY